MAWLSRRQRERTRLTLSCLDERALPSVTVDPVDAQGTLVIRGDQFANDITITDDGTGSIVVASGTDTVTRDGVSTIRVYGRSGADNVVYVLSQNLSSPRTVDVFLGNQHDSFEARLQGDLLDGANLAIHGYGGNGHDNLWLNAVGVDVAVNADLAVDFFGGNGADTLTTDFTGLLIGDAAFKSRGGNGRDSVTGNIVLDASTDPDNPADLSTGTLSVEYFGGNGVDQMTLNVAGAGSLGDLLASVNGCRGKDTFVTSDNVTIVDPPKSK